MKSSINAVLLITAALWLTACGDDEKTAVEQNIVQPVKLFTIPSSMQLTQRSFPAKVTANLEADLSFRISGVLEQRPPFQGMKVKQGQLLAKLEPKDAKNNLKNREADYELTSLDFKRKQKLLTKKLISKAEFDAAQAKLKSAKAALASAKDQLSYTNLYAPFDGIVAKVNVHNFQVVGANQAILTLQKNDTVDLAVQIPELIVANYISNERYKSIKATAHFSGKSFPVSLKEFATQVTTGTQSYEVVYSMTQPKHVTLLPGMTAEITFELPSDQANKIHPIIPLTSVLKSDESGHSSVWVFADGKVNLRKVVLGNIKENGIEVISGVSANEQIVTAGVNELTDGQNVKPLKWERGV
ncbi:efflux RND transporter periplasmic adaptor subunit [Parashewanella curva]|uniref:Efflux RND transporter periplasmic adaptor subunit n=1 Tax=Parashewanella curva TaxID=2338552 RepID=A0A3L8PUG3_9GAMM|nr:efflux RND transporter periplasmic adaptor subunit [Parashewanella curva]RLV58459.1 efflux RND transporter periplasmic adaptor subunit [Parashewanella curva]